MWIVWLVSGGATLAFLVTLALGRAEFRRAPRGWQLLALAGIALAFAGLTFIIRFWRPAVGPGSPTDFYPVGPYVNAWAVAFGFAWLAFGILFVALALSGARDGSVRSWALLLVSWALCWLPHGIIGVGFALRGSEATARLYPDAGSETFGWLLLGASALSLLIHFAGSIAGFVVTGRQVLVRRKRSDNDAATGALG